MLTSHVSSLFQVSLWAQWLGGQELLWLPQMSAGAVHLCQQWEVLHLTSTTTKLEVCSNR